MILLPAIDIKDGNCVRLYKGDYSTAHKVADDPVETAKAFEHAGAKWLHLVDLDGAKDGKKGNAEVILKIRQAVSMNIELGGGIRDMQTADFYFSNGINRLILGSAAIKNPKIVEEAVLKYDDKIAVGIDAKNGVVCAEGWLDKSDFTYIELAKKMEKIGVSTIIFTDISCDGMLSGPNLTQLDALKSEVSCNIIASGGVASILDIVNLSQLDIYGAIAGKALYTGDLDIKAALKICD